MSNVAAIVLAAGRSRRMGKFKPLLPFGDKTVIETVIDNLQDAGVDEIIVVVGHESDAVRKRLQGSNVSFVQNPNPDTAMSASIALGIGAISPDGKAALITPVDCPAVPPEVMRQVVANWRTGAELIQPEHLGKGGHPVLIDLKYRDELLDRDSATSLRAFFDKHREEVLRLPVASPFIARDMDTWDDYVGLHQAVFGRKPRESALSDEPNDQPTGTHQTSSK
jgi:molybdenum cofactor cytidylyltransferase